MMIVHSTSMHTLCIDLGADNSLGNAEVYGIVDTLELLWNKFGEVFFETDLQKKVSSFCY